MKQFLTGFALVAMCLGNTWAQDQLLTNRASAVFPDHNDGLWIIHSIAPGAGISHLKIKVIADSLRVQSVSQYAFSENQPLSEQGLVFDGSLAGMPGAQRGSEFWFPYYAEDSLNILGFGRMDRVYPEQEPIWESLTFNMDEEKFANAQAMALQGDSIWVAMKDAGVLLRLPGKTKSWELWGIDSAGQFSFRGDCAAGKCPQVKSQSVQSLCFHQDKLLLGAANGLYEVSDWTAPKSQLLRATTDKFKTVALSCDPASTAIYLEEAQALDDKAVSQVQNRLYFSKDRQNYQEVLKPAWDSLDISLNAVAWGSKNSWATFRNIGSSKNGMLRLQAEKLFPREITGDLEDSTQIWYWGSQEKITPVSSWITGISPVPLSSGDTVLAASTWGYGVALSADWGKNWTWFYNQTPIKGNLAEVRCIPSVIRFNGGDPVRIAYKLSEDQDIDIDIFSYDMGLVRNVISGVARSAHSIRSSNPSEDVWDGRDDNGRFVSAGLYYVRVKGSEGKEAWGKILKAAGPE